ncbi:MAG: type 1 glutamine amidotransferase domain-containing protein [Pseudomonadota bacterium]
MSKRILMISSNPAISPVTGWPIGFWWAELTHPWLTYIEAGYDVDIVSPQGGDLVGDGYSDPEDESGYSANDLISLGFKKSPKHAEKITQTRKLSDVTWRDYDAIMIVGGQGPMVTMIDDEGLHRFFVEAYEAGKIVCAICHGTCILLKVRTSDGKRLVSGKTWTGFANSEEQFAEAAVGMKIQPFWIESEAHKIEDTNFIVAQQLAPFAVRDGNLITGQQQHSGVAAANLVIEALGK